MHPLASLILGILSAVLFAVGGQAGQIGLIIIAVIGWLGATLPVPNVKGHPANLWVIAPFSAKPALLFSESLLSILEKPELEALIAHEFWHLTLRDRVWRLAAGWIGGCGPALLASFWLRKSGPASLSRFAAIAAVGFVASIIQSQMLQRSEYFADSEAAKLLGTSEPLISAILKLERAANESWGLYPEEIDRPRTELMKEYLSDLGGREAVARQVSEQDLQNLSLLGQFVLSLIDGKRTIGDIFSEATTQKHLDEFFTCRIIHQLKVSGVIKTEAKTA
jgi:Zn-dependent protease with chaperone function